MTADTLTSATRIDLLDAWHVALTWVAQPGASAAAASEGWLGALAAELYTIWYARYTAPILARREYPKGPALVHQLRAAHAATTRFASGWTVRAVGKRGAALLERSGEQLHLLPPDYVHLARPGIPVRVADTVSVTTRRDQVDVETGWWFTFGNGDVPLGAPMARVYWNCPADTAPDLVSAITSVVERRAIPYSMKCPVDSFGFERVDPFVLYLHRDEWNTVRDAFREVHDAIAGRLRDAVPRLALRLGRGVALAEDPANGQSFGESRSRAVADGALAAMAAGLVDDAAVLGTMSKHLLLNGIVPSHPFLRLDTSPELLPPW